MKPLPFIISALSLALLATAADNNAPCVNKDAATGVQPAEKTKDQQMSLYDISITAQDGSEVTLAPYKGKVLLIVNTATRCGFTPQYKELQAIYDRYRERGLEILDFPCNQFGAQAPGSNEEIQSFCTLRFGTQFPRFAKIDVNGPNAAPLYKYLTSQTIFAGFGEGAMATRMEAIAEKNDPHYRDNGKIKWNFTKFLIDREGRIIARFEPSESLELVKARIESAL